MRKIIIIILTIILFIFINCKKEKTEIKGEKGGTLKVVMPWEQLSLNLNPFINSKERLGIVAEIYESLMYLSLTGQEYPLLGISYKWINNNFDLIVELRKGAFWSDQIAFTSKDVVFTFNYIKEYEELDNLGIWDNKNGLKSVINDGKYKVIFKFSKVNTSHIVSILSQIIIPKHIWTKIKTPNDYVNEEPIGTGPFLYKSFSEEDNIIHGIRNPNYWNKNRPYIDSLEIKSEKNSNECLLTMLKKQADWSSVYIPNCEEIWTGKDEENNKYWKQVKSSIIWFLNNEKPPLNKPKFRKALAMSINKEIMNEKIYDEIGVSHPTGIPKYHHNKWITQELEEKVYIFDQVEALKLVNELGFTKRKRVLYGPNGEPVRDFTILVDSGIKEYTSLAQIISDNLKELGISTIIDQQPRDIYYKFFQLGTYDTGVCIGEGIGNSPYYIFEKNLGKIKNKNNTNFSRYFNKDVLESLENYTKGRDQKLLNQQISRIIEIFLDDIPYIPLINTTSHNIFSELRFVGWPSDKNPYADGPLDTLGGAIILSNVHLK